MLSIQILQNANKMQFVNIEINLPQIYEYNEFIIETFILIIA